MIKNWLTLYSFRYPRSLVYMMQASEYVIRDYIAWYRRTKDFTRVERRKKLVATPKALVLLTLSWIMASMLIYATLTALLTSSGPLRYLGPLFIILLAPSIIAYGMVLVLFVIKLVQRPVEYIITRQARQMLEVHRAVKIAIAGSFGKTTMREILKTVLSEGRKVAAPPHSYNTPLAISRFIKTLSGDEDILIFELGEYYPGDIRSLCRLVQPTIGIITGVDEAHLERFKTLERAAATVYELAEYLGTKPLYVNGESELAKGHARMGDILYSQGGVEAWRVELAKTDLDGTSCVLIKDNITLTVHSSLLGLHQIGPLAAAAHIGLSFGLAPNQVQNGIHKISPVAHRLEPKTDAAGVITLDDSYNGNPDGVNAAIAFLASLNGHRRWYVTPGLVEMGSRTEAVHKQIGRRLTEAKIEKVILIKNSVTSFIATGLQEAGYQGEILWFDDALAAYAALPQLTVKGDVVLLQNDWPDQYQ